jgi:hypothetical protein
MGLTFAQEKNMGIFGKHGGTYPKLSKEDELAVVAWYGNGVTSTRLGKHYGVCRNTILNILTRYSATKRSISEAKQKYSINHRFFEEITTEAQAYLLGLWATDGYLITAKPCAGIGLQERDIELLEKISVVLQSTYPLQVHPKPGRQNMIHLFFCSPQIKTDLIRHGIIENKTWFVRPWIGPNDLMRHYWRGAIDGDGSLYYSRNRDGSRSFSIDFCGNEWMVAGFRDFIENEIGYRANLGLDNRKSRPFFRVRYGGMGLPKSIALVLYGSTKLSLARKQRFADEIMHATTRKPNNLGRFPARSGRRL